MHAAQVLEVPGTWVPLVNLRGIYVLPGIPRLFRSMLEAHAARFSGPAHCQAELLTNMGEGDLAGRPRCGPPPAHRAGRWQVQEWAP
jgi:molybdopterin-biosynthesis enzyme MoeA-like protein